MKSTGDHTSISVMLGDEINSFLISHERKERPNWEHLLSNIGYKKHFILDDDDCEKTKKNIKKKQKPQKEYNRICIQDYVTTEEKKQNKSRKINTHVTVKKEASQQVDFPEVINVKSFVVVEDQQYVYRDAASKSLPTKAPDINDQKEFPKKI